MKLLNKIKNSTPYLIVSLYAITASAQSKFFQEGTLGGQIKESAGTLAGSAGYAEGVTAGGIVALLIQVVISLLGIGFVALIVYAGIRLLLARGNEEEVTKAKDIIRHAFWGLVITLTAWSISYFLVRFLALGVIGGVSSVQPGIPNLGGQ